MTETDIVNWIEGRQFAKNLAFVSSLLAIGFVMEPEQLASLLGLPIQYVRPQLENQSVRHFVLELRQKHLEAWSDA